MGKLRRILCVGSEIERYTAQYDGDGDRVTSTLNGTPHQYSYGAGLLHDAADNTVYTPGVSQRKAGADSYFHEDWLGSNRYLTDAAGAAAPTAYRFDAYGLPTASAGPDSTSLKFGGGEGYQSDVAMGYLQLGARLYDPAVGRFLSADPIGFAGGLNLYAYCDGDPVSFTDPSGLDYGYVPGMPGPVPDYARAARTLWEGGTIPGPAWLADGLRFGLGLADIYGIMPIAERLQGFEFFTRRPIAGGCNNSSTPFVPSYDDIPLILGVRTRSPGGNGGRGGGPLHEAVRRHIMDTAGGDREIWIPGARRAADVVDDAGRIHQIGDLRNRGGFRPDTQERAAIEDIRKAVGTKRTIIYHDRLGQGPSLINPDLQPGWKRAPARYRKNP